jgi:hypothetical protein
MPESYSTGPNRVIIRHKGPAGKGIPVGGSAGQILVKSTGTDYDTEWAEAPDGTDAVVFGGAAPVDNAIVIFNGTTGKLVKRSTVTIGSIALLTDLDGKVDVVAGKGLSEEDFTTALKDKLEALPTSGFRGQFTDLADANAFSFDPVPAAGDYVTVETPEFARYWWDDDGSGAWVAESVPYTPDAAELADILFDDGETWTIGGNIMFTPTHAAQLDAHQEILDGLGLGTSDSIPRGQATYFSLTGQVITIASISSGTDNFVVVNPATAVSGSSVAFTGGDFSLGQLKYTGPLTRTFLVQATVAHSGSLNDEIIFAVAKNGTVIQSSRTLDAIKSAGAIQHSCVSTLVSLATNDYVEVFVANADSTDDVTVKALNLTVTLA